MLSSVSMSTVLLIGSRVFCCCRSALSPPPPPPPAVGHLASSACLLASHFSPFALSIGGFCSKADFVIVGCRLSTVDCQGDGSRYPSHRHWLYHDQHAIAVRSALIKRLCMRYIAPNAIVGHRGSLPIWIVMCIGDRKEFVPNQNGKKKKKSVYQIKYPRKHAHASSMSRVKNAETE